MPPIGAIGAGIPGIGGGVNPVLTAGIQKILLNEPNNHPNSYSKFNQ
jgi:hypothetical protein